MGNFKSWYSYFDFANRIQRQNRFIRTSEDEEFFSEVLRTSKSRILELPEGLMLWRAQLGNALETRKEGQHEFEVPAAFGPERMKPLEGRAKEGRANPKGIPVLYLSNDRETAMSETRPWLGSHVSCAQFKTTRSLKIVDLSVFQDDNYLLYIGEPSASAKEKAVCTHIDNAFSEPVSINDNMADYVPTQAIAELFKNKGYDGIKYKSRFGNDESYNIVLFDPSDARLTVCILYEVKSLKYSFKQADNPYWIEEDGTKKTIEIVAVRPATQSDDSN